MTFEVAHFCRATRGHTLAYRDAERLGRPATESMVKALAGELVFRGSFRSSSRVWAISVAILSRSSGLPRCPSGSRWNECRPPCYDGILDGSVITARDAPGAMKDWPEIEQGPGVALRRRRQGGAPGN